MPAPSEDVSIAWLCLCPLALLTDLLALLVIFHFRPLLHSVDVALASLVVTMATNVVLLLPVPALIRLAGELRWTKDACTFYNWLASTLRASNILVLMLLNVYWVTALRTFTEPKPQAYSPKKIFSSSKLMKLAVVIAWVISIIIGLVPVAGETRVFDYYQSDFYGRSCWFLPYNTDIGFSLFFVTLTLASIFIGVISAGDTLLLFRQMRKYAVTKISSARRDDLPGVAGSDSRGGHPEHSELSVASELCLLGLCFTLCSAAINALPLVVSQFIQMLQGDYSHVAMETTLLWLLLVESLVLPHLLWLLSGRYRHALRYLWRVHILNDVTAKEEDAAACTLQAFRMKARHPNDRTYKNGSAAKQLNGSASHISVGNHGPEPGGSQGGHGDHTEVKVTAGPSRKTLAKVTTSSEVTELDDGMVVVTSRGAVPLKELSAPLKSSSPYSLAVAQNSSEANVDTIYQEKTENDYKEIMESTIPEELYEYEKKKQSPPRVWAARIAPRKAFNSPSPGGPTSQSTPNTPTKSLGISPNPPSHRAGSTSSTGSASYSRVKRSASATSRQEWKERMRKKHLPAIFVNTSFEEDNADSSAVPPRTASTSSGSGKDGTSERSNHVTGERELPEKPKRVRREISLNKTNYDKGYDFVQGSVSVERTILSPGEGMDVLRAPTQRKLVTMESEGLSDMYEDGDIDDILDDSQSSPFQLQVETQPTDPSKLAASSPLMTDVVHSQGQSSDVTVQRQEEESYTNSTESPSYSPEIAYRPQQKLLDNKQQHQSVRVVQGIDNRAFDMGTEGNLPGSADSDVFYDDTVTSPISYISTPSVPMPAESEEAGLSFLIHDTATDNFRENNKEATYLSSQTEVSEDGATAQTTTDGATAPTKSIPDQQLTAPNPRRARYRHILSSPSKLIVSSVDKEDDEEDVEDIRSSKVTSDISIISEVDKRSSYDQEIFVDINPAKRTLASFGDDKLPVLGDSYNNNLDQSVNHQSACESDTVEILPTSMEPISKVKDTLSGSAVSESSKVKDNVPASIEPESYKVEETFPAPIEPMYTVESSKAKKSPEMNSVSQDWNQLQTVSGSEMMLFKTKSVRTAAALMAKSSIDEEEAEGGCFKDESTDNESDKDSGSDGGQRVGEEEWMSKSSSNLASFSTLANLRDVGQKDATVGSYDVNPETPPLSPERDGNGDGAESIPDLLQSTLLKPLDSSQSAIEDEGANSAELTRNLPNLRDFRVKRTSDKYLVSNTALDNGDHEKPDTTPSDAIRSQFFISEDSVSDSVFESSLGSPKETSIESSVQSSDSHLSRENPLPVVLLHSKSTAEASQSTNHTDPPSFPQPLPSATPAVPPTQKPPRGHRRRNRGDEEVWARLTSSEDELDDIFSDNQNPPTKVDLGFTSSVYEDLELNGILPINGIRSDNLGDKSTSLNGVSDNSSIDGKPNSTGSFTASNPFVSNEILITASNNNGLSNEVFTVGNRDLEMFPQSRDMNGTGTVVETRDLDESRSVSIDRSVTLEPYGHRIPQWLEDSRNTQPEGEEYDLDSRAGRLYKKNSRPSRNNSKSQYNHYPPPPAYSTTHHYQQSPGVQLSPQLPLVQYHFDEDIDRGFEEALSMDYLPIAPPPPPFYGNSLFAPGASIGLLFESITEEPEDSLSLTEIAEASSLNGDNIFKTQAVISSRPSSRASFAASTDSHHELGLRTTEAYSPQNVVDPFLGVPYSSELTEFRGPDPYTFDFIPTSERTSADGSEAVAPPVASACHVPQDSGHSHSSVAAKGVNPWSFGKPPPDVKEISSNGDSMFDTFSGSDPFGTSGSAPYGRNDRGGSPWLELDLTVTQAPEISDNQLDMSFGSDFSSENPLGASFGRDGLELTDHAQNDQGEKGGDFYLDYERERRPSTPQQLGDISTVEFKNQTAAASNGTSTSDHGQNVPSVYF